MQPDVTTALVVAGNELRVNVAEAVGGKTVLGQLAVDRVTQGGFVTAYGCDDGLPKDPQGNINKADLNDNGNVTPVTSNRLIVTADNDGDICFYTSSNAEMIIDINGIADTAITPITNQRTDTRTTSTGPLVLVDVERGPLPTGCAPSTLASTTRVSIDPRVKDLLAGVNWPTVDALTVRKLAATVLANSGPLPAAISKTAEFDEWVKGFLPQPGKTYTIGDFWNALTFGYHETMHQVQAGTCAMTAVGQGYATPRIGPLQSETNDDVRARIAAIIPDVSDDCHRIAVKAADEYLVGRIAAQAVQSQLWEINAYVLDMEFEDALLKSTGTALWGGDPMNIYFQSAKLHQLSRYLTLSKATPGLWDQMRAAGVDKAVADHWNLAVSKWRPLTNGFSQRGCWKLAFGEDAAVIAEFTGGLAGTTAPPQP